MDDLLDETSRVKGGAPSGVELPREPLGVVDAAAADFPANYYGGSLRLLLQPHCPLSASCWMLVDAEATSCQTGLLRGSAYSVRVSVKGGEPPVEGYLDR